MHDGTDVSKVYLMCIFFTCKSRKIEPNSHVPKRGVPISYSSCVLFQAALLLNLYLFVNINCFVVCLQLITTCQLKIAYVTYRITPPIEIRVIGFTPFQIRQYLSNDPFKYTTSSVRTRASCHAMFAADLQNFRLVVVYTD